MSIYIYHPGSGTIIDLAECVVMGQETDAPEAALMPTVVAKNSNEFTMLKHPRHRTYLMAVHEGEAWDDGTHREVVVLDFGSPKGPMVLSTSGEAVKYYDDVHDIFTDIF